MQTEFDNDGGFDCDEEGGDEPLIQELDLESVVSRMPPELLEHTPLSELVSSEEPTPMHESTPTTEPTPPENPTPPLYPTAPHEETPVSVCDVFRTQYLCYIQNLIQQTDADPKLTSFLNKGCGCKRNRGQPCFAAFSREQYETSRMQCAELSRDELDLVILGQLAALLMNTDNTTAHRPSGRRQRSVMSFHHGGVQICRDTFLKLHGIGKTLIIHYYTRVLHLIGLLFRTIPLQELEGELHCIWINNQSAWQHATSTQECSIHG